MSEGPHNFENEQVPSDDVYECPKDAVFIQDYLNELYNANIDRGDDEILKDRHVVRSVEERYRSKKDVEAELVRKIIEKYPAKIARINQMTEILNVTQDLIVFKQATNEVMRLMYGREHAPYFKGDEFNPDLLGL